MVVCFYQDDHLLGLNAPIEPQSSMALNSITRKAGGRKEAEKEMQACDMFMYSTPSI